MFAVVKQSLIGLPRRLAPRNDTQTEKVDF